MRFKEAQEMTKKAEHVGKRQWARLDENGVAIFGGKYGPVPFYMLDSDEWEPWHGHDFEDCTCGNIGCPNHVCEFEYVNKWKEGIRHSRCECGKMKPDEAGTCDDSCAHRECAKINPRRRTNTCVGYEPLKPTHKPEEGECDQGTLDRLDQLISECHPNTWAGQAIGILLQELRDRQTGKG